MFKQKPPPKLKDKLLPVALLVVGLFLATAQLLLNSGSFIQTIFVRIEHPVTYRFTDFDQLLHSHAKGELVDYISLRKDWAKLEKCVDDLKHISPDRLANPEEELCFWINSYNLLVLQNILDHYPLKRVDRLANIMSVHDFVVGGKPYSVERIEENEIRPRLARGDARALFTMCGGARGQPSLLDHALEPARLPDDMNQGCIRFVNNTNNVFFDQDTNILWLSPFFKWNDSLLSKSYTTPFIFTDTFLLPGMKVNLDNIHIKQYYLVNFDWRLNDTAMGPVQKRVQSGEEPAESYSGAPNVPPITPAR